MASNDGEAGIVVVNPEYNVQLPAEPTNCVCPGKPSFSKGRQSHSLLLPSDWRKSRYTRRCGKCAEITVLVVLMVLMWAVMPGLVVLFLQVFQVPDCITVLCTEEGIQFQRLLGKNALGLFPQCKGISVDCAGSGGGNSMDNETGSTFLIPSPGSSDSYESGDKMEIICNSEGGFYFDENTGVCKPQCGRWRLFTKATVVSIEALVIVAGSIGIVGGVLVVIIPCISQNPRKDKSTKKSCRQNLQRWFNFPAALILYQTSINMVLELVSLVTYTDQEALFCSSVDLLETFRNPTPFCTFTGVLLYYALAQNYLWWFFIIIAYFWGIMFPLHYRRYKEANKIRYVHIVMFLLGVLLPIVPAAAALNHGFTAFGIVNHPPVYCSLDTDDNFFVLLLPLTILFTIGLCMLLVVFWKLAKSTIGKMFQKMPESREKVRFELKVLFLFLFYYFPFIISVLAYWAVSRHNSPSFVSALLTYFVCESSGISPGKECDRSGFETVSNPYFFASGVTIVAVTPVVNLVSVVNFKYIISKCKTWYKN